MTVKREARASLPAGRITGEFETVEVFLTREGMMKVEEAHSKDQEISEITFKYKYSENYNPVFVNGAHGGLTPQGQIVLNFYLERHPLPKSVTNEVLDGKLGQEIPGRVDPSDLKSSVLRYVQTGIVLDIKGARQIADFINTYIERYERMFAKESETAK